jgi:UDP-glucose-4-epimerase GalE
MVTGGAGYIGSHALRALRTAGHEMIVVDDLRAGRADFAQGAPLVAADVGDRAAMARVLREHGPIDGVLHFAASISVGESVERPMLYHRNNVVGSANLLAECLAHGVRAFVLSSTCATYGTPERQPISEDAPQRPINPYGASKLMVERMLAELEAAHGLRWSALRYFNACGADPGGGIGECHDPEIHLIPVALEAAAGLRPKLLLFGTDYPTPDGTCVRDYVHVSDLADAHVLAIEALLSGGRGGGYNLGTGIGRSNREIIDAVSRTIGKPVPFEEAPRRAGDPPVLVADASRFARDFGWQPRRSDLAAIVGSAWAWLREWKGIP